MAAEGKIDPMHQFTVEPLVPLHIGGYDISFTNSALWMLIVARADLGFMLGGHEAPARSRPLADGGRGLTGFIDDMVKVNIGPEGKKFMPYIFSLFIFILVANLLGLMPLAIVPAPHPFTVDQPFQHHRRARRSSASRSC